MSTSRILSALLAPTFAALAACAPPPPSGKPIFESTTSAAVRAGKDDPTVVAADAVSTPAMGAPAPLVLVTVFTDFQCPFCPRVEPFLENLRAQYPDEIQIQYRHFPLMNSHPLAETAAQAAAAAHRQGGFHCLARALYGSQKTWSGKPADLFHETLGELAHGCGLDAGRLASDMNDPLIIDRVTQDYELGRDLGVRGTPWVLVDGLKAELSPKPGTRPATLLSALVRRELREAQLQLSTGTPRADLVRGRLFGNLGDEALVDRLLDR